MSAAGTSSLTKVIEGHTSKLQDRMFTALPGVVEKFDPVKMTVDVRLAVKLPSTDVDGSLLAQEAPVLPNVPLCFPRANGYILCFPVTSGDGVLVVFSMVDAAGWEDTGNAGAEPLNGIRHGLSSGVAIPGWFPFTDPLNPTQSSMRQAGMVLGQDGTDLQIQIDSSFISLGVSATSFVALADKVATELAAVRTYINSHVHSVPALGTSSSPVTPMGASGSVAATKVKAK